MISGWEAGVEEKLGHRLGMGLGSGLSEGFREAPIEVMGKFGEVIEEGIWKRLPE